MNDPIIPGEKYEFSDPEFVKLILYGPRNRPRPRIDPPTDKQVWKLKQLGMKPPATKYEASRMIGEAMKK